MSDAAFKVGQLLLVVLGSVFGSWLGMRLGARVMARPSLAVRGNSLTARSHLWGLKLGGGLFLVLGTLLLAVTAWKRPIVAWPGWAFGATAGALGLAGLRLARQWRLACAPDASAVLVQGGLRDRTVSVRDIVALQLRMPWHDDLERHPGRVRLDGRRREWTRLTLELRDGRRVVATPWVPAGAGVELGEYGARLAATIGVPLVNPPGSPAPTR